MREMKNTENDTLCDKRNIEKIVEFMRGGCTEERRIGMELEHFICTADYEIISYDEMERCLVELNEILGGNPIIDGGKLLGMDCGLYTVTLEPGRQFEISIQAQKNVTELRDIYRKFRKICDGVFAEHGYKILAKGIFPPVEKGSMDPSDIPILPKRRYHLMDKHFQGRGRYGRYMMRASASTQIAVDYSSEEDALRKVRVLSKLAPVLALLMEEQSGGAVRADFEPHILRTQVWNDLDPDRCGYFEGSVGPDYSFEKYARHVYTRPSILVQRGDEVIDLEGGSAADFCGDQEIDFVPHLMSMYFPNVRIKNYIEYRIADSTDIDRAAGFAALIKALMYDEAALLALDGELADISEESRVYEAEAQAARLGYKAKIYGKSPAEWLNRLFDLAFDAGEGLLSAEEKGLIARLETAATVKWKVENQWVRGFEAEQRESHDKIVDYLERSMVRNHNRVLKTLCIPKLFTDRDVRIFKTCIEQLYNLLGKVIDKYRSDAGYRKVFGFDERLEELILLRERYESRIPMARIDIFYDEETGDYRFCEFNTDGTSAMNEDRELVNAFKGARVLEAAAKTYDVRDYELFDSWVDEFLSIYDDFAAKREAGGGSAQTYGMPNVAIVDILEKGTVTEFEVFKERFERRGAKTEICDIRDITWDGDFCCSKSGMRIDAVYRRAVTSDVMKFYHECGDFISAVQSGAVCLIGEFRTQIAHNKLLFRAVHMPETQALLTEEEKLYVRAHFPFTVRLSAEELARHLDKAVSLLEEKDKWIIKPEDSYGSKGVYAGVEFSQEDWANRVDEAMDKGYVMQEFVLPYCDENLDFPAGACADGQDEADCRAEEKPGWRKTSNLTGIFAYNGKYAGIYSRASFDKIISTQYNEIALPTFVVERKV